MTPRSCTEEEKVKLWKATARADMSTIVQLCQLLNGVLVELSCSQLDDIHASRAIIVKLMSSRNGGRGNAVQISLDVVCIQLGQCGVGSKQQDQKCK